MTPLEVQWRLDAETAREVREFERLAQLACWVMNPWLKQGDRATVAQLLGRPQADRVDWGPFLKG